MIVLKLGGSVITDKERPETLDTAALERAAAAISGALEGTRKKLVIVHGGGSFGHHNASEHGVSTTAGTREASAVLDIHGAMTTLNASVLRRLLECDDQAVPVHPFSAAHRDQKAELHLPTEQVGALCAEGFVPVLHGDLVAHSGSGATVVSGDELVVALATALESDRIGVCSTVPGVLDDDGEVIDRISSYSDVATVLGESEATDVTGGMAGKVTALLEMPGEASIFGLEDLEAFLDGEQVGTTLE